MARKLSFLAASDGTPLAKHYALSDGVLTKSSYPNVFHFDSHTESPRSLADFARVVTEHAALGHCLLKGELQRPLRHESRANSTATPTPTDWIALDFEGVPGINSFEDLVPHLPVYFRDVGYVEQPSASAGIEPGKGYSAHIFLLLGTEVPAPQLKEWLIHLNLATPILRSAIRLNKANTVLRWPLDITTCQNDKLLYIAPPILGEGVVDQFASAGERIRYVRRREATLDISFALIDVEHNRAEAIKLLATLREAAGLIARRFSIVKHSSGIQILKDAGVAQVTGWKRERGFCYLNLNGGDSWGYFHPEDRPEVLSNFKGEPGYAIRDFLPDYYPQALELAQALKAASKDAEREAAKQTKDEERKAKREAHRARLEEAEDQAAETGFHFLAVNDPRTDTYYQGTYDVGSKELVLHPTRSKAKLLDFLAQHDQPIPEFIPNWRVEYDFDSNITFDPEKRFINLYRRSEYLSNPVASDEIPPIISRLLDHVLGNDAACVEHFLNWLACIVQHRSITMSAWVLSGTQGTGKGVLFHKILSPLLGEAHAHTTQLSALQRDFNGFMERAQIVLVDEAQVSVLRERDKVMQALKHLISEGEITVHRKYQNEYTTRNRANFILASNRHDPIEVDGEDRRFNVAPRQETKLLDIMDKEDIDTGIRAELHAFAGYLLNRSADRKLAMTPIVTENRERLKELTTTTAQSIANHLKAGDLQFFFDHWPETDETVQFELLTGIRSAPTYGQILDEAFSNLGKHTHIPHTHIRVLFHHLDDVEHRRNPRFIKYISHKGLDIKPIWYNGKKETGLKGIVWHAEPELVGTWEQERTRRAGQKPTLRRIK